MKRVLEDVLQEDFTAMWILQRQLQKGQSSVERDSKSEGLSSREHIDTSPISIKNEDQISFEEWQGR